METITVTEGDYESPAFVTKDEWKQILSNKDIIKRSYIDALIAFYLEPGHNEPPRLYRRVFYLSQAAMPDRVKLS